MLIKVFITIKNAIIDRGLHSILSYDEDFKIITNIYQSDIAITCLHNYMSGYFNKSLIIKKTKIIVITVKPNSRIIHDYKNGTISGILDSSENRSGIISALKNILTGQQTKDYKIPVQLNQKANLIHEVSKLTARELQILILIYQGNSNSQIGEILQISSRTVDKHRTNAMKKLNLNHISGIIRFVYKSGITD